MTLNDNKTFYHGSKNGLTRPISPVSPNPNRKRNPADFGEAFYIGENQNQAKGVCLEGNNPTFYELTINFSTIPNNKIIILNDQQWLYTVLAFRRKSPEFSSLDLANQIRKTINNYDLVIGTIADDRMNDAINAFNDNTLTDKGLMECLKYIKYGNQLAIKATYVDDIINIKNEKPLYGSEADNIRNLLQSDRIKSRNIVSDMRRKYRHTGFFLDDIVEKAQAGEILINDIFPNSPMQEKAKHMQKPTTNNPREDIMPNNIQLIQNEPVNTIPKL